MAKSSNEILVVGAGPTGLTMACSLLRHGVPARLIEKTEVGSKESRAISIQPRTMEVLEEIGVLDPILSIGRRLSIANAYRGEKRVLRLSFSKLDAPYPFILLCPQDETERILENRLKELGGEVERSVELVSFNQDDGKVFSKLKSSDGSENTFTSSYLVGCDGVNSVVRKEININFEGYSFEETFAIADLSLFWNRANDEGHFFLSPDGIVMVVPLPGNDVYRIFVKLDEESNRDNLSLEFFQSIIDRRLPSYPHISLHSPTWMTPFNIHYRVASSFQKGKVFLAGEAAHVHGPLLGQGMNLGIQDSYNLAWKLASVQSGVGRKHLLKSYTIERHPIAANTLTATEFFIKTVSLPIFWMQFLRNLFIRIVLKPKSIQNFIKRAISQLASHYRKSLIVKDAFPWGFLKRGLKPGDRVPDIAKVQSYYIEDGQRLFDLFRGTKHHLLLFCGTKPSEQVLKRLQKIATEVTKKYEKLIVSHMVLSPEIEQKEQFSLPTVLKDEDGTFHKTCGVKTETLLLVRPDGYIGFRSRPAKAKTLFKYLEEYFA
ncbi:FAD-dependent monooxygenase [Bdellovibrionota bacterium]